MNGIPFPSTCAVRAIGVVEAAHPDVAVLRKNPGPPDGRAIQANLLNHADDQTVVAMAAILHAIHNGGLHRQDFTDWAVVGAPRFPGRTSFAVSLDKFRRQGPLSASPLIIPFQSLHSVSSMASLALQIHGPALGIGGGTDGFMQALLTGLTLRQEAEVPGVWVVATGWDPEIVPGAPASNEPPICRGVALALLPETAHAAGSRLRLVPRTECDSAGIASPTVFDLVRFLTGASGGAPRRSWFCPTNADYSLEMTVADGVPSPSAGRRILHNTGGVAA